jgi:transposase
MEWLNFQDIWIYSEAIDFRKQMNGLIEVVLGEGDREPNDGSLYVFRNRQRTKLKLLVWDRNGYFLGYKRLEKGRFDFPMDNNGRIQLTKDELFSLVSGMPIVRIKSQKKVIFHH